MCLCECAWVCFALIDFPFMSGCRASAEGSILREDVVTVPARHFPPQRKVCVTERVPFSTRWCFVLFFHNQGERFTFFKNDVTSLLKKEIMTIGLLKIKMSCIIYFFFIFPYGNLNKYLVVSIT